MIEIPLTRGMFALIDDEDYELVSRFRWEAKRPTGAKVWYALTRPRTPTGIRIWRSMHQLLTGFRYPQVDHKNGNGLDNRRENLRPCNNSQNQANRKHLTLNTSGFRGVTWHRQCQKWQAGIKLNGRNIHLGLFEDPIAAAAAYDAKAIELFGEFANTNFPSVEEREAA